MDIERTIRAAKKMGVDLTNAEAKRIARHARNKMKALDLDEDYFGALIVDEIKNYLFRAYVNSFSTRKAG